MHFREIEEIFQFLTVVGARPEIKPWFDKFQHSVSKVAGNSPEKARDQALMDLTMSCTQLEFLIRRAGVAAPRRVALILQQFKTGTSVSQTNLARELARDRSFQIASQASSN